MDGTTLEKKILKIYTYKGKLISDFEIVLQPISYIYLYTRCTLIFRRLCVQCLHGACDNIKVNEYLWNNFT